VRDPAVFLLDEPLSNLDAKLRASMRTELIKLHNRLNTTFVYVTHDQTEAMTMGDRIVVMKDGYIQQVDTPQNLYDRPCNIFVAGFIGSPQMNFLDVTVGRDAKGYFVETPNKLYIPEKKCGDKLAEYIGKTVKLGVRPENIYDDAMSLDYFADSVVTATVDVTELMGSEVYLYLKYADTSLTARVKPDTSSKEGNEVKVAIDTRKIHLFDVETERAIIN